MALGEEGSAPGFFAGQVANRRLPKCLALFNRRVTNPPQVGNLVGNLPHNASSRSRL